MHRRAASGQRKDDLQNGRKYLRIMNLTRDRHSECVQNPHGSAAAQRAPRFRNGQRACADVFHKDRGTAKSTRGAARGRRVVTRRTARSHPAPTRAAATNTGRGESGRRRWDPRASLAGMDRASTVGHSWAPTPEDAPEVRGRGLRAASARPRSRRPHSQREPTCASTGERQVWGDQHGTGGKINNTVRTTRSARRGRDTSGGGGRGRRFVRYLNV